MTTVGYSARDSKGEMSGSASKAENVGRDDKETKFRTKQEILKELNTQRLQIRADRVKLQYRGRETHVEYDNQQEGRANPTIDSEVKSGKTGTYVMHVARYTN